MTDKKLNDRIERALEGLLSEQELQALQAEIVRDPAARAAYTKRAWLHSELRAGRDRLPSLLAAPVTIRPKRWPIAAAAATLAACLTLVACLLFLPRSQPAPTIPIVATLTQADNC